MFAGDEDSSGDEDGAASEEEKNEEEQQPSGGAGGSKATPLAGPTACARVSSLSLKDGFDFSEHDSRGPVSGYSARLVAEFCVRRAGAHYGLHQCVKLTCTRHFDGHFIRFPFVECRECTAKDTLTLIRTMGRRRRGDRRAVGSRRRQRWRFRRGRERRQAGASSWSFSR
jgi:hypothetical protein